MNFRKWITTLLLTLTLVGLSVGALQAQGGTLLSHIRVAHYSPDAPAVNVFLNGEPSGLPGLSFGDVSGWVQVVPGTYEVVVSPVGADIETAAIGPADITVRPGAWVTIAATGSLGSGTLGATLITEDYSVIPADETRVTVFHGIEDAPAVDVILPDGTKVVSNLAFKRSATVKVPAGTYDLLVVPAGSTEPVVIDLSGTALSAQTFYLVAATNALAAPQVSLAVVPQSAVAKLQGARIYTQSIFDIVDASAQFSTLQTALELTELDAVLDGAGSYTVFAPTNAAFAALPAGTLDALIADPATLTSILLYHVSAGTASAADVVGLSTINMLNGAVSVDVREDGVYLNDSVKITTTDVFASNGVIHIIDAVLVP
jgi:uncharacterized surface protein with fasciclin (FAS1) repeats